MGNESRTKPGWPPETHAAEATGSVALGTPPMPSVNPLVASFTLLLLASCPQVLPKMEGLETALSFSELSAPSVGQSSLP